MGHEKMNTTENRFRQTKVRNLPAKNQCIAGRVWAFEKVLFSGIRSFHYPFPAAKVRGMAAGNQNTQDIIIREVGLRL